MKNSPLTAILLGILVISALGSACLCWSYGKRARELRALQTSLSFINSRNAGINALASDALEYSKTHPDINPILEAAGVKPRSAAAPAAKPLGR
jgi:hypothetical protein